MSLANLQQCPNCRAPLPASRATIVGCAYCGHSIRLRADKPALAPRPRPAPAPLPQAQTQTQTSSSRIRWFVAVPMVVMLVIGGAASWMASRHSSAVANARAARSQGEARAAEARARAEVEARAAHARVEEAQRLGKASRAKAGAKEPQRERDARRAKRHRRKGKVAAKKAPSNLPKTPSAAAVERVLGQVDAMKCTGVTKIGYTLDIQPDGTSKVAAKGPIFTMGPSGRCVDEQVDKLRFPKSQEGMRIKHIYFGPEKH